MTPNDVKTLEEAYNKYTEQLDLAQKAATGAAQRVLILQGARLATGQLLDEARKVCDS